MANKELRKFTICEAQEKILSKEISPVDLIEAYIERIDETEEKINSFTQVFPEEARKQAKGLEAMQMAGHFLGPLHGIPVAIKDNIDMAGFKTTASSQVYENNVAKEDAPVVAKLKEAGSVFIGKPNMHEFAWGICTDPPVYGASRNPWNPDRFCSGSSGGSGGTVANGTSLAALGTDTGGSVRLPASVCGLVGIRPTLGRIPTQGIVPLAYTLDSCGPLTRTVKDNALMFSVMSGYVPSDPTSANVVVKDFVSELEGGVKNMRIGYLPDVVFAYCQPDIVDAIKNAMETFKKLGAEIVEIKVDKLELMHKAWYAICGVEASAFHQKNYRERPQEYGRDLRMLLGAGELIHGTAYVQAQRFRRMMREQFKQIFKNIDLMLFPTLPYTAVPVGEYDIMIDGKMTSILPITIYYTCRAPIVGMPALSVPCGLDKEGLPIGMDLLANAFCEDTAYRAAYAFEKTFSLADKLPIGV